MNDDLEQRVARLPLPPFRQFQVSYYEAGAQDVDARRLTTETITAHILQHTGKGRVLLFSDYRYVTRYNERREPVDTIITEIHRIIPDHQGVREVESPKGTLVN